VTAVNTTLTLVTKTTGCVASPRPKAPVTSSAYVNGIATGRVIGRIAGAWLVATRKSMTVPAFHDRWPLCSPA
jgi:hypothetical protein